MSADTPPRLGVSSCLLGERVRYDGEEKRCAFVADVLGPHVEWLPVCPEAELGLGVPRERIRLTRSDGEDGVRLLGEESARDLTAEMTEWAAAKAAWLAAREPVGYVLKARSPSCGLTGVETVVGKRVSGEPWVVADGRGLFATALLAACPGLPVVDEDGLREPSGQRHFVERLFAYRRLQGLLADDGAAAALATFHERHELQLLSHAAEAPAELRAILAEARDDAAARYAERFNETLARPADRERHLAVFREILRRLAPLLPGALLSALVDAVARYEAGWTPREVPRNLLREAAREIGEPSLRDQTYLEPEPLERRILAFPDGS